ncbi:MAG: T9SS type A sorting domain-containing protein, partial [Bacteroidales bacterium]
VDFTFTNNIVSKLYNKTDARPFRINELAGDFTFAYSTIHDFTSTYDAGAHNLDAVAALSNVDTINIYGDDPGFADTDYYNFSIYEGNPLLTAGSDGGAIGDPRWLPYTAKKVVSIGAVLKRVIPNYDVKLTVKVDLPPGINKSVTWEVENGYNGTSGAATIDASGLLSPTAVGDVKVTATSNYDNELFDTLIVTIVEQIFVTSISLSAVDAGGNPTTEITNFGGFLTITAVIEPGDADDKSLSWEITDADIVNLIEKTPTTAEVVAKVSGTIDVIATANDGSETSGNLTITVSLPDAVENTTYNKLKLLPNPASDFIRISSDQVVDVVITNITGTVVMTAQVQPNGTMNISELKAGMYIVTISTRDILKTIQLIVE